MFSIGEKIKQVREYFKMSQKEFSNKLGISAPYLSEIENNKKDITSRIIQSLNQEFNVSSDWLLFQNTYYDSQLANKIDAILEKDKTSNIERFEINEKIRKVRYLYQRLIDIKLMNNKLENKEVEDNLSEFTEKFSNTMNNFVSDLVFTRTGFVLYEIKDKNYMPKNINELSNMEEYNDELNNALKTFEEVFFENFNKFYDQYMKDWYNSFS